MKVGIYSINDSLSWFNDPFFAGSDQIAIRQFHQYYKKVDLIADNPSNFTLFKIGEFDNEKGTIEPMIVPENLMSAVSFVVSKEGEK